MLLKYLIKSTKVSISIMPQLGLDESGNFNIHIWATPASSSLETGEQVM